MKRALCFSLACAIYLSHSWTIGFCLAASGNKNIQGKGLDLSQIEALIKNRTPDSAVALEIKERGVSFQPIEEMLANLRVLGAGDRTLQILRLLMNRPAFSSAKDTNRNLRAFRVISPSIVFDGERSQYT